MATVVVGLLCALAAVAGSPLKTYDQRQQGELNIHAQLDNIVILLIPTSGLNLLELAGKTRFAGQKGSLLQILQKPLKDIDRYETVKDDETAQNDIKTELFLPALTSQQVDLKKKGDDEKDEEVVATVEEMKPATTEKAMDPPTSEATEDNPIKEHSTISETVQESVLKVTMPEEMKDAVEVEKEEPKERLPEETPSVEIVSEKTTEKIPEGDVSPAEQKKESEPVESVVSPVTEESSPTTLDEHSQIKETSQVSSDSWALHDEPSIKDFIKPVAAKEDTTTATKKTSFPEETSVKKSSEPVKQDGTRKERVIRYKPETKWAPGLVDLLGPPKPKARELEERHRYAGLCAPGVWDTELKTCIMPGETRSRNELARFLEAMRFGIAVPNQ